MNRIGKAGVLVSSLSLAGGLIAYQSGCLQLSPSGAAQTSQPAAPSNDQGMLFTDSKYSTFKQPAPGELQKIETAPSASNPAILLPGSKESVIWPGNITVTPEVLMSSSKGGVIKPGAPASAPSPDVWILLGGSKSKVPIVSPPVTQPATQPATQPVTQPARQGDGK